MNSMANIKEIEGIGPAFGEKLTAAGIATQEALLKAGASRAGREEIAAKTGIAEKQILDWVNRADLARISGIGSEYADLLEAAGVDSVPELAQRSAANLATKLSEINESKKLVRSLPTEAVVDKWIEQAKGLDKIVTH